MGSDNPCCCWFLIITIWLARPPAGDGHPAVKVPEAMGVCVCLSSLPTPVHSLQLPMSLFPEKTGLYEGFEAEHGLIFTCVGTILGAVTSIRGVEAKELEEARTS